ncbi:MAG: thiamine-phosphate kinase [Bacteroidia bacterium]|nr:thiamine-phosphate kinase [Bacteroidia bacterium]
MLENPSRTELSSLGEFGLIEHLKASVELQNESSLKGIGDDAAVIEYKNKAILVSTDMLVEGVHFDLTYVPLKHLGYKAVVVNVSDIYAMNGTPKQITVSIAMSNRFSVEAVEELYSGILLACKNYEVDLVGGDTSASNSGLVISITAIGEAEKEEIVYRSGAKDKDLICVTGDLGGAFMGLQILEREKKIYTENPKLQPDLEGKDYVLERQLKPEARKDIPLLFKTLGIKPTSMIDISDGLASELIHLCKQSETGCNLYEDKIPLDTQTFETARQFNMDPTVCALNGGEDYELLFTVPITDFEKVKNHPDITIIGHMLDNHAGMNLVSRDGTQHPITAQGWDAFFKR